MPSAYDAHVKTAKDSLQIELSNTLKRRKPVAIVDPPKYQYPTTPDVNKTGEIVPVSIKPINVNHTLGVVSSIKLPEGVNVSITPNTNKATKNEKPLISHAKPNYTLPGKKPESSAGSAIGLASDANPHLNETTAAQLSPRLVPPKLNTMIQSNKDTSVAPAQTTHSPPVLARLQTNQTDAADLNKSTIPKGTTESRKLLISHGKPNFIAPAKTQPRFTSKTACNQTGNYLSVKIKSLKPQRSIDDSSSSRIADKKAIFDKASPSNHVTPTWKTSHSKKATKSQSTDSKGIHATLNRLHSADEHKVSKLKPLIYSGHDTLHDDSSNDSGHSSPLPQPSPINKSAFEQHVTDAVSKSRPNGRKDVTSNVANFEQRTVVSFAKELNDSPNRYPEQVRVIKTVTSSTATTTIFDNIRFSINDQSQVIPKLKHWIYLVSSDLWDVSLFILKVFKSIEMIQFSW